MKNTANGAEKAFFMPPMAKSKGILCASQSVNAFFLSIGANVYKRQRRIALESLFNP